MPTQFTDIRSPAKRLRWTANLTRENGFSLVELLVVVIIIAVLVAIAVPLYTSAQQTARDRADEANVRILNSATLQWVLAEEENNNPKSESTITLKPKLADYVQEWPVSPSGNSYELEDGQWTVKAPST